MAIADEHEAPEFVAGYRPWRNAENFYYDHDAAEIAIRFIEKYCVHVKGRFAGKPLLLEGWQRDLISTLYGWRRNDNGLRRYRWVYCEVPRKNGKSTLCAGFALRQLIGDQEDGAEVYSCGFTRDQSAVVFNTAASMVRRNKALSSRVKVLASQYRAIHKASDSFYRAAAGEGGAMHGTNPSAVVFDELHVQKNRILWESLTSGFGSRDQPIMFSITTAGHDRNSICWDQHTYAEKVRDGLIDDPTFLPVLYSAEPKEDWTDEEVWHRANPNLGVSVSLEYLRDRCLKAKDSPAAENEFRNFHLNQWTQQAVRAIPMAAWEACKTDIDWSELKGKPCWAGLDLASTRDLCAFAQAWLLENGTAAVRVHFFISEANAREIERKRNVPYTKWARDGWITITHQAGGVDYKAIEEFILRAHEETPITELRCDRWNVNQTVTALEDRSRINCVLMGQGKASMSSPTKFFIDSVIDGQLIHDGNETMTWHVDNLEVKPDDQENMVPQKGGKQEFNKIDGCVATIMALSALQIARNKRSVYEDRGPLELDW